VDDYGNGDIIDGAQGTYVVEEENVRSVMW